MRRADLMQYVAGPARTEVVLYQSGDGRHAGSRPDSAAVYVSVLREPPAR